VAQHLKVLCGFIPRTPRSLFSHPHHRKGYNPIVAPEMKIPAKAWAFEWSKHHHSLKTMRPQEFNKVKDVQRLPVYVVKKNL
jgi:hypothetical protein